MTAAHYEVLDPATLEVVGQAPENTEQDVELAVAAARAAAPGWATDREARRVALRSAAALIRRELDSLATLLSREQGKPKAGGRRRVHAWPRGSLSTTRTWRGTRWSRWRRAPTALWRSSTGPWAWWAPSRPGTSPSPCSA